MNPTVELTVKGQSRRDGASRRDFLYMAGMLAAVLGLPNSFAYAFSSSLKKNPRIPVVWLEFQDCTGDTESFLRGGERTNAIESSIVDPGIVDLLLDVISLEYHETIMAPSGLSAEKSRDDIMAKYPGKYLVIVEGAIPTGANGAYCTIGGRSALSIAQQLCSKAKATLACGSCSVTGCLASANPNPTGAKGVLEAFPSMPNVLNMPGCPANVVNITAAIAYLITYGKWPSLDSSRRPEFAYGKTVHERCPRKERFEDGPWAAKWGDTAHRTGGCLVNLGCRGPKTRANCPSVKWMSGVCWPVASGHGCIGCTEPRFWDTMFPYYSKPLPHDD